MVHIASEEELAQQQQEFTLLPEEDYLLEVREWKITQQPDSYNGGKLRDILNVVLNVVSFANGEELYDIDGADVKDRRFFDFLDPSKTGMKPQPAKARKFFTSCFGQSLAASIDFESYDELVGKRLIGSMIHKKNREGKIRQAISGYRPIRNRQRPPRRTDAEVVADAEDTLAPSQVAEIFGDVEIDY